MNELTAEFCIRDGKEYVALSGGYLGKDVIVREVGAAERRQYAEAYEAWKAGPPTTTTEPVATTTLPGVRADGRIG